MAFVVEDGTGLADANSYTSLAFADAYFADRSVPGWAGEDGAKQSWLIQATDYVQAVFGRRMLGTPLTETQALHFPAIDADPFEENEIPVTLQKAVCEYAIRAQAGPLLVDPAVDPSGFTVVTTKKKVGPIEKEFSAVGGRSSPMTVRPYPAADFLMIPVLKIGAYGSRVIR